MHSPTISPVWMESKVFGDCMVSSLLWSSRVQQTEALGCTSGAWVNMRHLSRLTTCNGSWFPPSTHKGRRPLSSFQSWTNGRTQVQHGPDSIQHSSRSLPALGGDGPVPSGPGASHIWRPRSQLHLSSLPRLGVGEDRPSIPLSGLCPWGGQN